MIGKGKYAKMTTDDFDRILEDIIDEEGTAILQVPGVAEIVSEHFNNEVLERWEAEQPDAEAEA